MHVTQLMHRGAQLLDGRPLENVLDSAEDALTSRGVRTQRIELDAAAPRSFGLAPAHAGMQKRLRAALVPGAGSILHLFGSWLNELPAVLEVQRELGLPVFHSLYDFHWSCAARTLVRHDSICEDCLTRDSSPAVQNRCSDGGPTNARAWRRAQRRALTAARKDGEQWWLVPSQAVFEKLQSLGLDPQRFRVLAPPVHDVGESVQSAPPDPEVGALYIGPLTRAAGVDLLVEAWRGVRQPLTILGDGPLAGEVHAAGERNSYLHWQPEAGEFERRRALAHTALLLAPSRVYEPLGTTVVQAMSLGRPVIATDIGAHREAILPEQSGLLLPPGNSQVLRSKAQRLLRDRARLLAWGERAREHYQERFHPEAYARNLCGLYEEAAGRESGPARAA